MCPSGEMINSALLLKCKFFILNHPPFFEIFTTIIYYKLFIMSILVITKN